MNEVEKMLLVINNRSLTDISKMVGCSIVCLSDIKRGRTNPYNVRWWIVNKVARLYDVDMKG